MNRQELAKSIADQVGVSQTDANKMIGAFIESVQAAVVAGDKVSLVGFGSFESSERGARTGKNPQTGAPVQIPARKVPKFVASKVFKDAVKG